MQERVDKKRLLITASTFPRYEEDTEPRFILDLAKELQKYLDVTVLVPAAIGAADKEILEGVRVERYHYFPIHRCETLCYPGAIVPRIREKKSRVLLVPFLFLGLFLALWKRRKQYDHVHANWLIPQGIIQGFLRMPFVLTGHGTDVSSLNKGIIKTLKRKAVRRAKVVTVVSVALKDKMLSWFSQEERKEIEPKVFVQPMGCDTSKFSPLYRKENLWQQEDKKVILFVGRLAEIKGVQYLIEAMQWVDAKLVIAGDGPLRGDLEERVRKLELADKVIFVGAKSHEELPVIYASADVFVAPSVTTKDKAREGFGLVILEAMASGLPVVASGSGGITEIITDGVNGLLTEEKDSQGLAHNINRILTDESLRGQLVQNMQETVKKYDFVYVGEQYAKLILS